MNKEFWNERYSQPTYTYGEAPNVFLKAQLDQLPPGKILFPAEGEGRNAVYAATLGWKVVAFDQSEEAQKKALSLAAKNNVEIDYDVVDCNDLLYTSNQFDAIGLIYAHFPAHQKSEVHKKLITYLKPKGMVIFEAFSKKHIAYNTENPRAGGPKDLDMLFSMEEIRADFENFEVLQLTEEEIELNEGLYHVGSGSVIRFVGRRKYFARTQNTYW